MWTPQSWLSQSTLPSPGSQLLHPSQSWLSHSTLPSPGSPTPLLHSSPSSFNHFFLYLLHHRHLFVPLIPSLQILIFPPAPPHQFHISQASPGWPGAAAEQFTSVWRGKVVSMTVSVIYAGMCTKPVMARLQLLINFYFWDLLRRV